jgi:hypothetical protein
MTEGDARRDRKESGFLLSPTQHPRPEGGPSRDWRIGPFPAQQIAVPPDRDRLAGTSGTQQPVEREARRWERIREPMIADRAALARRGTVGCSLGALRAAVPATRVPRWSEPVAPHGIYVQYCSDGGCTAGARRKSNGAHSGLLHDAGPAAEVEWPACRGPARPSPSTIGFRSPGLGSAEVTRPAVGAR